MPLLDVFKIIRMRLHNRCSENMCTGNLVNRRERGVARVEKDKLVCLNCHSLW